MRKIKTLFERDWENDPSTILKKIVPSCKWAINNEGIPTQKFDGTACMVKDGILYRRYDRKRNRKTGDWKPEPEGWIELDKDEIGGHWLGWVPVDPKRDKWHYMAWQQLTKPLEDGTYELCGIHFQNNPEHLDNDTFLRHGSIILDFKFGDNKNPEVLYQELKEYLKTKDIEGIVWHNKDGRMTKIKKSDFKLKRV